MITFIRRAPKRWNWWNEDPDDMMSVEVSYHVGYNSWMYELSRDHYTTQYGHHFDSAEEAMIAVADLLKMDYRIMDIADLKLEKALLGE